MSTQGHFPLASHLARAALVIGCITALPSAQATDFALGPITAPVTLSLASGSSEPFTDDFSFSIGSGLNYEFTAALSTGFSNRAFILDMEAALYKGASLLLAGDAITRTLPEGFPSRDVSFSALTLGEGDYHLRVTGTPLSSWGIAASYSGSIGLAEIATPVPEPDALSLMALGLGATGFLVRRRRHQSTPVARLATRV